ncbi:MAG: SpoIID/LytB domain-containing protein [Clostridia bacterium]
MKLKKGLLALICGSALLLQGCASTAEEITAQPTPTGANAKAATVAWPSDKLKLNQSGVPAFSVHVVEHQKVENMDVESYVEGVLAGEMKNTWPMEALKAQAILARTFVLKFIEEKQSKYENADISTDIEEAQAYDASAINERVKQAVAETNGLVLSASGALPYAWFHAHSGGMTELAKPGLGWNKDEPAYTQAVKSNEPESVKEANDEQELKTASAWEASFPTAEFAAACDKQGVKVSLNDSTAITIKERGESGRATVLSVGGKEVRASELRIALGSTKMRSTLLETIRVEGGQVKMSGKGYGHGVGMSQWGAYGMAEQGKSAEEIVKAYFKGVELVKIW